MNELRIAFRVSDYMFRPETTPKYLNSRSGDKSLNTGWAARAFPVIPEKPSSSVGAGRLPCLQRMLSERLQEPWPRHGSARFADRLYSRNLACGCFHTTTEVRDGKSLPTGYKQQGQTTAAQPPLTVGHYSNTCARLILAATLREVLCRSSTPGERPKTERFLKKTIY